jgi:hypothetical protein
MVLSGQERGQVFYFNTSIISVDKRDVTRFYPVLRSSSLVGPLSFEGEIFPLRVIGTLDR